MPKPKRSWFALCVHPEFPEEEVKRAITKAAKRESVKGVGKVIVARHKSLVWVGDRQVTHRVKSFPGYLILALNYCTEVQVLLDGVKGVVGLLPLRLDNGSVKPKPTALASKEAVEIMLRQELSRKERPNPYAEAQKVYSPTQEKIAHPDATTAKQGLGRGDSVRFVGGPFAGTGGEVERVLNRSEVCVVFSLMGKNTRKVCSEYDLTRD
jgi:transcription antitermination factor NusG